MKNFLDDTTILTGIVSSGSLVANFFEAVDIAWKIIAIISGIISISCFVYKKYLDVKEKIEKAKEDGKITKDEAEDIAKTLVDDLKELGDNVNNTIETSIKNDENTKK